MKILKTILIIFLVLIIAAVVAIAIFLKTFDINKYKPQIIHEVSKTLGRGVTIDDLNLNLSIEGATVGIKNLKVKDNPQFSKGDFLTVKDLSLGLDVLSLVTKHQILVSSVKIRSPKIVLIRNEEGQFNVQTFRIDTGKKASNPLRSLPSRRGWVDSFAFAESAEKDSSKAPIDGTITFPLLLIQSIKLEDGLLVYKDKAFDPEISIDISQIYLAVNNFSLAAPFDFILQASLWSRQRNLSASGLMEIDKDNAGVSFSELKIASDLSGVSTHLLEQSVPMLKEAGLGEGLEGKFEVAVKKMIAGAKGLSTLSLNGHLEKGKMRFKQIPLPLTQIESAFQASATAVKISDTSFNLGTGTVKVKGDIDDYLKEQKFRFTTEADAIDLREIVSQKDQPVQLHGKLYAGFDVEGKGLSINAAMLNSLSGEGTLEVKEGKLVGINVLRLVLSKISMLPGLVEQVEKNLPEKYKEELNKEDTVLNKVKLKTAIKNRSLVVDSAEVETDVFLLSGNGNLHFNQELDMQANISIPQDLSRSMAASAKGLEYILDESGQIVIPLRVSGKIPNLAFLPDLEYLGKKIILNRGKEELEKVSEKAFGKAGGTSETPSQSGEPSSPQTPSQTPPSEQGDKKSQERELIESILDKVFH